LADRNEGRNSSVDSEAGGAAVRGGTTGTSLIDVTSNSRRLSGSGPAVHVASRLAVAAIIYQTLEDLDLAFPRVSDAKKAELPEVRRMLRAEEARRRPPTPASIGFSSAQQVSSRSAGCHLKRLTSKACARGGSAKTQERMSKRFTVIAVLATTLACARTPTTVREGPARQAHLPADDEALKKFEAATEAYVDLHRKLEGTLPKLPAQASPAMVHEHERTLERLIAAARSGAREGDVFVGTIQPVVRRICREVLSGRDGRELVEEIREEAEERKLAAGVHMRYPDEVPLSAV
jgi:hypothetical protein